VNALSKNGQSEIAPQKDVICAIYITYHPDAKFPERMARLAPQVAHILVIDNDSDEQSLNMLRALSIRKCVELIQNKENLGVAAALNQGARRALELGYKWALMLDQDSVPEVHMVETLTGIYRAHPEHHRVRIIGSNYRSPVTGVKALNCEAVGSNYIEVPTVITSCSLMCLNAFRQIGPFREDFFIDQVDHEYCLRLRSHGYKVLISCEPIMVHPLGNETRHKFWRLHPICTNHSPLRRYYMMRNRVVLYKKYVSEEPKWVRKGIRESVIEIILILLFEGQKLEKLRAMIRGIVHGLFGRMGKL
jgi:rhamnosyltransferase